MSYPGGTTSNIGGGDVLPGGLATGGQGDKQMAWHNYIFGGGDKQYLVDPRNYDPRQMNQGWIDKTNAGIAGLGADQNDVNVNAARNVQRSGRADLLNYLSQLQSRPLDSYQLGNMMLRQGQQGIAQQAASQLASAPGRFNPAAMRQAQMGAAAGGQNMALAAQQQALASAIQEQAARDAQLRQGYGQLNENDIRQLMAEQQQRMNDQGFWGARQQIGQNWSSLGLQEKAMDAASRRAYEQTQMAGYMGKDIPSDPAAAQFVGGLIGAIGKGVAGSDRRIKHSIRPASAEARTLLSHMARSF